MKASAVRKMPMRWYLNHLDFVLDAMAHQLHEHRLLPRFVMRRICDFYEGRLMGDE